MTARCKPRGGAPVGYLNEFGPVEAGAILYLRLWDNGVKAQTEIGRDFARALGPVQGAGAFRTFQAICDLCGRHGRRPLLRHHVQCTCVGGDEACFAHLIGAASDGEREDAMLLATLIVRADVAPLLADLACDLGMSLRRMALVAERQIAAETRTVH